MDPDLENGTPPIRVMIVDDHKAILWGLQRLVESAAPRMHAVASASSCAEVLGVAEATRPDVILLDLDLNGESSLCILPALLRQQPARVLVLTGDRNPASHRAAIQAGARGVVLKDDSAETVLQAITHVHAGEVWIDRQLLTGVIGLLSPENTSRAADATGQRIASLTPREREIIRAVVAQRGAKSLVIAEALGISEHTLRNHLSVIYEKLGLRNRIDLFVFAREHDLAAAP